MAEIQNVTGTAFIVAEFRADENKECDPLYKDEFVELFLDAATNQAAVDMAAAFTPLKEIVKIRTRYLDDKLDERFRSGCRQVVILGAGLDTRSARKRSPGVTYFEIDHPSTLSFKKARFELANIYTDTKFIYGDYVSDNLINMLEDNEFNFDLQTHLIWEGNTMYLTAESMHHVMAGLSNNIVNFTLSFDYMTEAIIDMTTGDTEITAMAQRFAAMGAPWTYGIGNIHEVAAKADMIVVDNHTSAALRRIYRPNRPIDSPLYEHYSLCTLEPTPP